jgi:hypothetical protein
MSFSTYWYIKSVGYYKSFDNKATLNEYSGKGTFYAILKSAMFGCIFVANVVIIYFIITLF